MNYDIRISATQLRKAAFWAVEGQADVELAVDDRMLLVEQGDERTAFDIDGSVGSEEYLANAPIDPTGPARYESALTSQIETILGRNATDARKLRLIRDLVGERETA